MLDDIQDVDELKKKLVEIQLHCFKEWLEQRKNEVIDPVEMGEAIMATLEIYNLIKGVE